jgi:serine O-acetyltransferase
MLAFRSLWRRGVEIPVRVPFGPGLRLAHGAFGLVVHESTVIGANVRVYQGVTIGRADQYLTRAQLRPGGGVVVGDGVILGSGCKVLFKSGQTLHIEEGAVIGANAVVLTSVPAGEIWAGAPAKRVSINPNWAN